MSIVTKTFRFRPVHQGQPGPEIQITRHVPEHVTEALANAIIRSARREAERTPQAYGLGGLVYFGYVGQPTT